jgi:hypothetical protein
MTADIKFRWIIDTRDDTRNFTRHDFNEMLTEIGEEIKTKYSIIDEHIYVNKDGNVIDGESILDFSSLEQAVSATKLVLESIGGYMVGEIDAVMRIDVFKFDVSTPLLKYLPHYTIFYRDDRLNEMFSRYERKICDGIPLKKAIWECQKEMIAFGYEGNAKW